MIQLSFSISSSAALPTPPEPLRLAHRDGGARLTGVWADATLAAARAAVGEYLTGLPDETGVFDLFCGIDESAVEAARRLTAPPTVANSFAIRHARLEDRVWLRLLGMYQLGRPDLLIAVEADVDMGAAYALASRLAAWKMAPDAPLLAPDRPLPYGFWLLGFGEASLGDPAFWSTLKSQLGTGFLKQAFDDRMTTPAPRIVLEADDVLEPEPDQWLIGASRAARTASAQRDSAIACGLSARLVAPNAHDACVVCSRIDHEEGFFAYREAPQSELDSGWRFACLDAEHPHDSETTRLTTLSHLPKRNPGLVRYLALPEGWVVSYEQGGFWLRAPGEAASLLDERPGLDAAPWLPTGRV